VRPTSERGWTARIAAHGGEREALRSDGRVLDQATLVAGVEALAARLAGVGIEAGDLVAVLAPPSVEGVMLVHAFLDRGVVLLPLNARLGEAELDYVMASSGAGWLFAAHDEARAAGLAERADCGLVRFGPDLEQADGVAVAVERQPRIDGHEQDAAQRAALCAQDAALVLYTSGTSGRPKGAVLGFDSLMASAVASTELLGSQPDDRWLLCMPLFHVGGLSILTRAALAGTSVVLHERFDPQRVSEALDAERITQLTFVATMLARLLEVRGARRAPESLRFVLVGGGPAPQPLLERARALGFPLAPTYGLTETASQAATRPPDAPVASEDDLAAGLRALPGVEIRVVDRARRPLGVGEEGEIEVRGPIVMAGYLGDPEATARVLHEGWLATGDIGRLDASGGLRVLDRRTDLARCPSRRRRGRRRGGGGRELWRARDGLGGLAGRGGARRRGARGLVSRAARGLQAAGGLRRGREPATHGLGQAHPPLSRVASPSASMKVPRTRCAIASGSSPAKHSGGIGSRISSEIR
jgi:O-succinylbenzoic acid--CoA ligase